MARERVLGVCSRQVPCRVAHPLLLSLACCPSTSRLYSQEFTVLGVGGMSPVRQVWRHRRRAIHFALPPQRPRKHPSGNSLSATQFLLPFSSQALSCRVTSSSALRSIRQSNRNTKRLLHTTSQRRAGRQSSQRLSTGPGGASSTSPGPLTLVSQYGNAGGSGPRQTDVHVKPAPKNHCEPQGFNYYSIVNRQRNEI